MTSPTQVTFSQEEVELWNRVVELWDLARGRDAERIESLLHPDYVGWDMNTPTPHDRAAAVQSVSRVSSQLQDYQLHPHSVRVYNHGVGVVHYSYAATVVPAGAVPSQVTGKWTEIYLREGEQWRMIAVSGRPDQIALP